MWLRFLDIWLGSTNKETTSSVHSQNPKSLTHSKKESSNIFPYCYNLDFIIGFILNIARNNKENQTSLNDTNTLNSHASSTLVSMASLLEL